MMDRTEKDEMEQEKRNEDPNIYNSHGVSLDWPFPNTNVPMNLVSPGNLLAVCKENEMGSSSASMEPFAAAHWDHPVNVQSLGYCDINVQGTSDELGTGKVGPWNPHISMLKEGMFLPNAPGTTIPESLTQFPTDSGFIERAARFSCFNGGNFSDMVNPYSIHESMGIFHGIGGGGVRIPGPREIFSGGQTQRTEVSVSETSKDVIILASEERPLKNAAKSENNVKSHDEARQTIAASGNDSDEAEFSGGGQDEAATFERAGGEPSSRGLSSKKRKRDGPTIDAEADATLAMQPSDNGKDSDETQAGTDPTPDSVVEKSSRKNNKQGSQPSDPPKEYIHVRARRGQATNSHSLAERVRREKISERMKFLQDLVPGCSKVTGKAVMLDEIINYVQSLQRQVEFLSMKLATVNPRVELNLEGLLPKDILQSRPGPSSTLGFFPDMPMVYSSLHSSGGLIQGGGHAAVNSDAMSRIVPGQVIPTAGGFKESAQMMNMWHNELDHVLQMGIPSNATSNSEDIDAAPVQPNHTKIEQ